MHRIAKLLFLRLKHRGRGGNDTADAIKLQICGNIGIGSVGGRGGIGTHILSVLNTNTCEPLDVGKEDRDFLVAVDVDLVELGGDELA